jgi:hypothetical protein
MDGARKCHLARTHAHTWRTPRAVRRTAAPAQKGSAAGERGHPRLWCSCAGDPVGARRRWPHALRAPEGGAPGEAREVLAEPPLIVGRHGKDRVHVLLEATRPHKRAAGGCACRRARSSAAAGADRRGGRGGRGGGERRGGGRLDSDHACERLRECAARCERCRGCGSGGRLPPQTQTRSPACRPAPRTRGQRTRAQNTTLGRRNMAVCDVPSLTRSRPPRYLKQSSSVLSRTLKVSPHLRCHRKARDIWRMCERSAASQTHTRERLRGGQSPRNRGPRDCRAI